jgi:hypothetical protein
MKVKELIEELQQYDPELTVNLHGYEGGYYEPTGTRETVLAVGVHEEWYYGPNEDVDYYGVTEDYKQAKYVIIS